MKTARLKSALTLFFTLAGAQAWGHGNDDPILTKVMIDRLELRDAHGANGSNPVVLEAAGWIGMDLHKLWLKVDVQRGVNTTDLEVQALYSHAIAPFWDLHVGIRHDGRPAPSRQWGVMGLQGTAPYHVELNGTLFVGESGAVVARFTAHKDLLITQKWVLSPSLELNVHGYNDRETGTGSGLSNAQAGLRLRYEIRRGFAPYIGVNWHNKFGNTGDFARREGADAQVTQWVMGMRIWF